MKIALRTKWPVEIVTLTLELFFSMQALLKKQGAYIDTKKWQVWADSVKLAFQPS
jgi:hypothetical protein